MQNSEGYRSGRGPRHTRLALAVGCALALSLGAGVHAAPAGSGVAPDAVEGSWHLPTMAHDFDPLDTDDAPEEHIAPFAVQDALIRSITSGEVDFADWADEFAANRAHPEPDPDADTPIVAATRVVTNCDDTGPGSLRAAIDSAQNNDVIDMSSLSCGVISLGSFLHVTVDNLTLKGDMAGSPGKYLQVPIINGPGNTASLIRHTGSGTLGLEKLTLSDGSKYGSLSGPVTGGCVNSTGAVSLVDVTITDCVAKTEDAKDVRGGAVYADSGIVMTRSRVAGSVASSGSGQAQGGGVFTHGTLRMQHSTIDNNTAVSVSGVSSAGGVAASGVTWIDRSTISRNSAGLVGGFSMTSGVGSVRIKNTTVSGNTSTGSGKAGGVHLQTTDNVVVRNNTFTDNVVQGSGANGPGLYVRSVNLTLESNILSGNRAIVGPVTYFRDANFEVAPEGSHNLVGHLGPGSMPAPADTIQQVNTRLGPLQNNGGHTPTRMPGKGSWAINEGHFVADLISILPNPGGLPIFIFEPSTDQSDAPRTTGAGTDIGAYESDTLFAGRFETKPLL